MTPPRGAPELAAVARAIDLTPAETRLLERLLAGESLAEARRALNIAETTAKTHLGRIFTKAGVSRQRELLTLVGRLAAPVEAAG